MKFIILLLSFFINYASFAYVYYPANNKMRLVQNKIEKLSLEIEKSPSMDLYLNRAKAYIENKEYSYAIYDLDKVLKEDNYHLEAYILKANAYFLNNNYANAKKALNEVFGGITYDLYKGTNNNLFAEAYYIRSQIKKNEEDESWQTDYDKAIQMGYKEKSSDEDKSKTSNTQKSNTGFTFEN